MSNDLQTELDEFRDEVRAFLADYQDVGGYFHHEGDQRPKIANLYAELGKRNWLALAWPEEVGGQAKHPLFEFVLWNEMARARAVRPHLGAGIIAKTIIGYGTDEQKKKWLPGLRAGLTPFALGYSEPEAGSDLASLRTKAVLDGDHYVVNGEKRWTSGGHRADFIWLLCRTGTQESRGRGLTLLIVDVNTPGITISPIDAISGERFNEVFFDDVRIPVENRIGDENGAWALMGASLATERHVQYVPARIQTDFEDLVAWLRERDMTDDPVVRHKLADVAVKVAEVEAISTAMVEAMHAGNDASVEAAMSKLAGSEVCQEVARLAGDLGHPDAIIKGNDLEFAWRQTLCETIGGGTSEIMRGLIAGQALGLSLKG